MAGQKPQKHGSIAGYRQHQTRNETPCTECRLAYNKHQREAAQRRKADKQESKPAKRKDRTMSNEITVEEHERGISLLEDSLRLLELAEDKAGARDIPAISRQKAEIYEQIEARQVAIRRIENPVEEQEKTETPQGGFQLHIVPNVG